MVAYDIINHLYYCITLKGMPYQYFIVAAFRWINLTSATTTTEITTTTTTLL